MERRAADLLELYGLSEREALVLLFIVKRGSSSAGEIAKALQLRRVEAYKLVKKLAEANLIHASPGKPLTYRSQPLESFITSITEVQTQKLKGMEMAKEELITLSRNLPRNHSKASDQQ
ncbi:MAG: TrmB family transcriptional regulator, partial [Thaumarchaeota archaeon]